MKALLFSATALMTIGSLIWWLNESDASATQPMIVNENSQVTGSTSSVAEPTPKTGNTQNQSNPPAPVAKAAPFQAPSETQGYIRHAIAEAAEGYAYTSQFPTYSIPLDRHQTDLLQPNAASQNQRDLSPAGLPMNVNLQVDSYRYEAGATVTGSLKLNADQTTLSRVSDVELSVRNTEQRTLQQLEPVSAEDSDSRYDSSYDTGYARQYWQVEFEADAAWQGQLTLVASITLRDGQQLMQSTPFEVMESVALITGVGQPYQQGNEWIIPVRITDASPGYYKLGAALLDGSGEPLAYLQGQQKFSSSSDEIELKVWGSLLHQLNEPQQLILTSFQLRNVPARPGETMRWGTASEPQFKLPSVDPANFSNEQYQDEQAQARLEFLKALGNPDT